MAAVSGFVLAGGKSSRMGRNKALLELDGRPLIEITLEKLRAVCDEVFILSGNLELAPFGTLVPDLHPGCGPLGGMEAGLTGASHDWSLFLPVDMPLVPKSFLAEWVRRVLPLTAGRVALFDVDGIRQPAMCMVHREVLPFLARAVRRGEYKVLPVLEEAATELAGRAGIPLDEVLLRRSIDGLGLFANVNTPEEFTAAQQYIAEHGLQTGYAGGHEETRSVNDDDKALFK